MAQAAARCDAVILEFPRRPRPPRSAMAAPDPTLGDVWRALRAVIGVWADRWVRRRRLETLARTLPDEALADLGYSRGRAAWEARKPFWRA